MILKLAFLSCVFVMGVAVLMEVALFLLAKFSGSATFSATQTGWFLLFGIVWLGSFGLSYHIVVTGLRASLHR